MRRPASLLCLATLSLLASTASAGDPVTWTKLSPPTSPSPRSGSAIAYDAARSRIVLHGGTTSAGVTDETWEWDGSTWANVTPMDPAARGPKRGFAALAFDAQAKQCVLVGEDNPSPGLGPTPTFTWDGKAWTSMMLPGFGARIAPSMVYDTGHQDLVVAGGAVAGAPDDQVWSLATGTDVWMSVPTATRPPYRYGAAFVFDAARGVAVYFGGQVPGPTPQPFADTWEFSGTAWKNPATTGPDARAFAGAAFAADRGVTVLFGGLGAAAGAPKTFGDTWEWDGKAWASRATSLVPAARAQPSVAYDAKAKVVVLFGGLSYDGAATQLGDTWVYKAVSSNCQTSSDCNGASCVDGVCCGSPACGTCEACNIPGSVGLCAAVVSAEDADTCSGTKTCDAKGTCGTKTGGACAKASDCATGFCVDGVCCDGACTGHCQACTKAGGAAADGACTSLAKGSPGTPSCAPYKCGGAESCAVSCAADDDCATGSKCTAGACVPAAASAKCGDAVTMVAPDGTTHGCAPYRCAAGACTATCTTSDDCSSGSACNASGRCVAAVAPANNGQVTPSSSSSSGCVAAGPVAVTGAPAIAAWLAVATALRARRRAREKARARG
jgi:hypothetical protein